MDQIFSSMYFSTHPLVLHISTSYCNIHTEDAIHALRAADKYKERSQYLSHVVDSHQGEAHVPPPVFIGSRCPNITICSISGLGSLSFSCASPCETKVKDVATASHESLQQKRNFLNHLQNNPLPTH